MDTICRVLFWFHKNNNAHTKAKVKPPRLNGATTGVFSTRSPYRPNPIGLSLASLDKVDGEFNSHKNINPLLHWCFPIWSDIARPVGSAISSRIGKHQCNNGFIFILHVS